MTDLHLDQRLIDAAIAFVERRFPGEPWAGAAAMYLEDGEILISTAPEVVNDSVSLCHEVGAMCEAYARDKKIIATACVSRAENGRFVVLPACGVCQERLWYWGGDIEVAVPLDGGGANWKATTLAEMSPFYWRKHGDPRISARPLSLKPGLKSVGETAPGRLCRLDLRRIVHWALTTNSSTESKNSLRHSLVRRRLGLFRLTTS